MAIYQAATGEWFNSDDTTSGPGAQISAPSWAPSAPSGGGGGGGAPQAPMAPMGGGNDDYWSELAARLFAQQQSPQGDFRNQFWQWGQAAPGTNERSYWESAMGMARAGELDYLNAPQAPMAPPPGAAVPGSGAQQPGQKRAYALPGGGTLMLTPEEWAAIEPVLTEANQRTRAVEDRAFGLEQGKLDVERAAQQAQKAYQESMMQFNNAQMAQQAANQAMEMELRRQTLELQRQQMQYDRRKRGGSAFSRARVRIV